GLLPDTVYGFKVAAVNANGTLGEYSGNVYVRTQEELLPAPAGLRAAVTTSSSIKMFWNTVPGASYYRFYRNGVCVAQTTNAYFTSTELDPNTVYGFKVVAANANGTLGEYSGNVYVRTLLPAPTGFCLAAHTSTLLIMHWNAVADASYYRFYRNGVYVESTPYVNYTSMGLDPDTVYGFKVVAVNANGTLGEYSQNVYARTLLSPPSGLRVAETTTVSIKVCWDAVEGASNYRFYRNDVFVGRTSNTYYTSTGLDPDTLYRFKVLAENVNGSGGELSTTLLGRTAVQLPAPQGLTATDTTSDFITLSWDAVAGASYYRFYQNGVFLCNVSGTSYTATGLSAATFYGFKVAAVDVTDNLGVYSSNIYILTKQALLPAPQNFHVASSTIVTVTLAWTSVPGADRYQVYVDGRFFKAVTTNSAAVYGLNPNTLYSFSVVAGYGTSQTASIFYRTPKETLAKPQNLHATSITTDSITLMWDSVADATTYTLLRNGAIYVAACSPPYTVSGLHDDTMYNFIVVAVRNGVYGSASTIAVKTQQLPDPPANLAVSRITISGNTTGIRVTWDAVTENDADHYILYRDNEKIATLAATVYADTVSDYGARHYYNVSTVNASGKEGPLSPVCIWGTWLPEKLPAPVLSLDDVYYNSAFNKYFAELSWTSVPHAVRYYIYWNGDYVGSTVTLAFTFCYINTMVNDFTVVAVDDGDIEGEVSNIIHFTVLPLPH
ncbi:MAG: fibronectin type III domain-containing protein, partial [Eubacteriales bacterium]|nr:fibronectin type III domain-containing protein [Eubacteriales bacterium]